MVTSNREKHVSLYISITIVSWTIVMLLLFPACSSGKKELGEAIQERDSLPSMVTYGVNSLISDSGVIRYRLQAEEWMIFDKKKPPYWSFEKGVYLEKFDSLRIADSLVADSLVSDSLVVDALIKADTAYFYERTKIWELRGNVYIKSQQGDLIETDLLFWNQNTEKVYTDKYALIEQGDNVIHAHNGFESNQQLSKYTIYNNRGIFYFEEEAKGEPIPANTSTDQPPQE